MSEWDQSWAERHPYLSGLATFLIVALVALAIILLVRNGLGIVADYCFVVGIGLMVGATELMGRYRDKPFRPLLSWPGAFYMTVNAGASALAFFLMNELKVAPSKPAIAVALAGIGAMAFFRSGIFIVKIGNNDVSVGPNLVLQILLRALDREYDRARAIERSFPIADIMDGISFDDAKLALPSLCFSLMQNVSDEEISGINADVKQLSESTISPASKSLSLGLSLFNVVGEETLRAAVQILDSAIMSRDYTPVPKNLLIELARIDVQIVINTLPVLCSQLVCSGTNSSLNISSSWDIQQLNSLNIGPEAKAFLVLNKVHRRYGEAVVTAALQILPNK
jgi:hypothetical protein